MPPYRRTEYLVAIGLPIVTKLGFGVLGAMAGIAAINNGSIPALENLDSLTSAEYTGGGIGMILALIAYSFIARVATKGVLR